MVLVVAGFLAFGLSWVALDPGPGREGGGSGADVYPAGVSTPSDDRPRVWLVDGYNVVCAGVMGVPDREHWWSEANRTQLVEVAEGFEDQEAEIWVVFDGDRSPEAPGPGRAQVVFATSADDWLLEQVRSRAGDAQVALVTGDRQLAERARHRGAEVVAPRDFVRRCMG